MSVRGGGEDAGLKRRSSLDFGDGIFGEGMGPRVRLSGRLGCETFGSLLPAKSSMRAR
jgi:hypothetical protein